MRLPLRLARPRRLVFLLIAVLVVATSACSSAAPEKRLAAPRTEVEVLSGLSYWSDGNVTLKLDACLPPSTRQAMPAVIVIHGGGFTDGDRRTGGSRALCELTASYGLVGFSIDYRLAPTYRYPAQVDDLSHAITWLRQPAQVKKFGIDPASVALIGSSAGAIIAQSLATRGQGPLDAGDRVDAVISLSGVSLMTPQGLTTGHPSQRAQELVLNYLGCATVASCPQSEQASSLTNVDPSDPPMLLVNGTQELVPVEQPQAMEAALKAAGVPSQLMLVPGDKHGAALLSPSVRTAVRTFLAHHL